MREGRRDGVRRGTWPALSLLAQAARERRSLGGRGAGARQQMRQRERRAWRGWRRGREVARGSPSAHRQVGNARLGRDVLNCFCQRRALRQESQTTGEADQAGRRNSKRLI